MRGGSDQLSLSCFRLQEANASPFKGHLRWPVHRQNHWFRWHLSSDQTGQSCDCWLFVRIPEVSSEFGISRYANKRTREPCSCQAFFGKERGCRRFPASKKERLFISRMESRRLSSPTFCKNNVSILIQAQL